MKIQAFIISASLVILIPNVLANDCTEFDIEYVGNDLGGWPRALSDTDQSCQQICETNSDCHYFTYNIHTKTCHLKNRSGNSKKSKCQGCFSGSKHCSGLENCILKNVSVLGDFSKTYDNVKTSEECHSLCESEYNDCSAWTFKYKGDKALHGLCYLHEKAYKVIYEENAFSGPNNCNYGKLSTKNELSTENIIEDNFPNGRRDENDKCSKDTEYTIKKEGDYRIINDISTAQRCQAICIDSLRCDLWTYKKNEKVCINFPKDISVREITSAEAFCGNKYCTLEETINDDEDILSFSDMQKCFPNTTLKDGDIDMLKDVAMNPAACQSLCRMTDQCALWTFNKESNICYLKGDTALSYSLFDENAFSGNRICEIEDKNIYRSDLIQYTGATWEKFCHKDSIYLGSSIKIIAHMKEAKACQWACRHTEGCFYWNFLHSAKQCQLKDIHADTTMATMKYSFCGNLFCRFLWTAKAVGSEVTNNPDDSLNGIKTMASPENDICLSYTRFHSYNIAIIRNSILSAKECQSQCRNTSGCSFWTYTMRSHICELKNSLAYEGIYTTQGSYSGDVSCTVTQHKNAEKKLNLSNNNMTKIISGYIVHVFDSENAAQCHRKCTEKEKCNFWEFSGYNSDENFNQSGQCILRHKSKNIH